MIIDSNGIKVERLREKDIELVRTWRNSQFVKQYMNFRDTITPEMQKTWFKSIDNFNNLYFIIHYKNEKVGLGNIKNIDWEKREGEVGIFISKQKFIGSILPLVGSITLSDLVFQIFKFNRVLAQIRHDNLRSKKLSTLMGSKLAEGQEGKESQLYYLTRESFYKSFNKFFILMKPMGFSRGKMKIVFDKEDIQNGIMEKMSELIESSTLNFERKELDGEIIYEEKSK